MSGSVQSGKKMLDPPPPDLIWLHAFSQNGPRDLRRAAARELVGWAVAGVKSQNATAAWKVAAEEGKPELYLYWAQEAERHLQEHHRELFPLTIAGLSQLRPGGGNFLEAEAMKRHIDLRLLAPRTIAT